MRNVIRRGGPAAVGVLGIVSACAPSSVVLEHSSGDGGDGGNANISGAGGTSSAAPGGGASGASSGSAGRGVVGRAGAPSAATGGDAGGDSTGNEGGQGDTGATDSCGNGVLTDVRNGHDLLPGYLASPDPRVEAWLGSMSISEQIGQMKGVDQDTSSPDYYDIMRSPDVTLGDDTVLRGYWYRNGTRGVGLGAGQRQRPSDGNDFSTAFPAPSIRAASWDLDLEWRVGDAIGDETAASMNNLLIAPNVDIVRHPYWGRTQDAYGEDTYHVGRMGTAFVAGVQRHVGACAAHFIGNAVERFRSLDDALTDEQTLREIYARPFEMVVRDGGVACVMAAYNKVNGVKSTINAHLLQDILKTPVTQGGFGFRGFVLSDWWAAPGDQSVPDAASAQAVATQMANAGLDVEVPWTLHYGRPLESAVAAGDVPGAVVSASASRVLEQKTRFHSVLLSDGWGLTPSTSTLSGASIATNAAHLALAEQAEVEAAVLLANGPPGAPVLPIHGGIGSIAVIGEEVPFQLISTTYPKSGTTFHFASDVALGDQGSNLVNADPAQSVGPFAGIKAAASHVDVEVTAGTSATDGADADLLVVVVGYTPGDEGEEYAIPAGGDRSSLNLPSGQPELVADVLALGKPTVIVIESGSVVDVSWLSHTNQNQATIWAGYGGMRAGTALGKLLFGDASFSGKLPFTWPKESALPRFRTDQSATLDYFVGYRDYDRRTAAGEELDIVFPFGHGLSYTTFGYRNLVVPCTEVTESAVLDVTADVTNTGTVPGDEVAFLFVAGPPVAGATRSQKELKSFARVALAPGATEHVHLPVRVQDLKHWDTATSAWVIDAGEYTVLVGSSGADAKLAVAGTFTVPG